MNAWIEQYLRPWTMMQPHDWASMLSITEYMHNSWQYEGTRFTPYELLTGCRPHVCLEAGEENILAAIERLEVLENT